MTTPENPAEVSNYFVNIITLCKNSEIVKPLILNIFHFRHHYLIYVFMFPEIYSVVVGNPAGSTRFTVTLVFYCCK
jgi:hypothetical protein